MMKAKYYLLDNEFVIEDYNRAKAFSSFLPGIAGLRGKPLWAFYVNRAQCMAAFGIRSKDGAIMEFHPANTAYRRTPLEGFRTFIKEASSGVYEPFRLQAGGSPDAAKQTLYISPHEFRIEEISRKHSLKTEVIYFTVPNENFPALARILRVENLSSRKRNLEIIDGMPKVVPHGMNEFFMKEMSRTIEAWMETELVREKTPFYRLKVSASDVSRVEYIKGGNFYLSVTGAGKKPDVIVDPKEVFGDFEDFTFPGKFAGKKFMPSKKQRNKNITPSAFSYSSFPLPRGGKCSISSLAGYAESAVKLKAISALAGKKFFEKKRSENQRETDKIASSVSVSSGIKAFDAYVKQTNLDNMLRGGYPATLPGGKKVMYVFNRKHGDLERDYNNFILEPEFYSQGNGNFRDTSQNRRLSVWINPKVGSKDVKDFYNLIQLDGFNPLIVKGERFSIKNRGSIKRIAAKYFNKNHRKTAERFLSGEFTAKDFMKFAENALPAKKIAPCFEDVANFSSRRISSEHGEGYWIDHWTYNLDLLESYLSLFPEKEEELLFREKNFVFFDNPHRVKPRSTRYIKDKKGIRQYESVHLDAKKKALIDARKIDKCWVRVKSGKGATYRSTLTAKILTLIANKMASIDAHGRGIEMEADKPGWCDSLNGLPGILGSSACETAELLRLVNFLGEAVKKAGKVSVDLPSEVSDFASKLTLELKKNRAARSSASDHKYWDNSNAIKENYRERVRFGLTGGEKKMHAEEIREFLSLSAGKLKIGLARTRNREGIPQAYFINEAKIFDGRKKIRKFTSRALPLFLEGVVRALKTEKDKSRAKALYLSVRKSDLYDRKLGMYKLNAPLLNEPLEIGRSRVFTPGWLENESIWLHMEYKYLLEILKSGLYEEFYEDFKNALIPFQDPSRYGRSILENSSFIASSSFFNKDLRGTGFVARLTGATVELLNILFIMNLGKRPFLLKGGKLIFKPEPVLHKMLFTGENRYTFSVFVDTTIEYYNPGKKNTFGKHAAKPVQFTVRMKDGKKSVIKSPYLKEPISTALREGKIANISIFLG